MIALKIHRKKYLRNAVREWEVHLAISSSASPSGHLLPVIESFLFEDHACLAFPRHGRALDHWVDRKKTGHRQARGATRQLLEALKTLHGLGFTHTDLKAGNILYDPATKAACLADLGNARRAPRQGSLLGSREYVPPEVLLGAPLGTAMDLWSLGCCVMEMLTGRVFFNPRKSAARKYREFAGNGDSPLRPAIAEDLLLEEAEQFAPGTIIAGKYRLIHELGRGRFSTVWATETVRDKLLESKSAPLGCPGTGDGARDPSEPSLEREWRKRKGADDLPDLVLNYEHVLLMCRHCGSFPPEMVRSGLYRSSYFEADGGPRFRPEIEPCPIGEYLRGEALPCGESLEAAADFLDRLLQFDPARRPSAAEALNHPWLRDSR
jgi:serine/threonine protein kinase